MNTHDAILEAKLKVIDDTHRFTDDKSALLIIDMQYDFLPGGSFGVPEGDALIQPVASLITAGAAVGSTIICTRDYPPHDHASFNTQGGPFPPHCVQGTAGSYFLPRIASALAAAKSAAAGVLGRPPPAPSSSPPSPASPSPPSDSSPLELSPSSSGSRRRRRRSNSVNHHSVSSVGKMGFPSPVSKRGLA